MSTTPTSFWKDRLRACVLHFAGSTVVAVFAAVLVFGVWYPYPYREISGGRELFQLLVAVDVIAGPLITFAVFDRRKTSSELTRDLLIVVALQISALGYGLWTLAMARPVHMVFEIDRFRIVHAVDVPTQLLEITPAGIDALPYHGPTLLGLRAFRDEAEKMGATMAALQGLSLSFRPDLWQSYDASRKDVLLTGKPASLLKSRFPESAHEIDALTSSLGEAASNALYLPLVGRKNFWTVLVDGRTGDVLGYLALDSF